MREAQPQLGARLRLPVHRPGKLDLARGSPSREAHVVEVKLLAESDLEALGGGKTMGWRHEGDEGETSQGKEAGHASIVSRHANIAP